jgi:hypothetical protein
VLRVTITAAQVPGRIFVPIHWNDETAGRARVGALIHPFTDPHSGQPDSKTVPAALALVRFSAHGFVLARTRVPLAGDTVFAWTAIEGGYAARFATNEPFAALFEALAAGSRRAEPTTYYDPTSGIFRAALILRGRLDGALFFGAVWPRHGGWSGLTAPRAVFFWRVEALPPTSTHNLRMLWREIAGHLGGNRRWRMFDGSGGRAAQCRQKLRIVPARAEANDRRADARKN